MKYKVMRNKNGIEECLSIYKDKDKAKNKLKFLNKMVEDSKLKVNEFYLVEIK